MGKNYVSRTIAEALESIKLEHGPAATIVNVWEFQRRNEYGQAENWVGVTVDGPPSPRLKNKTHEVEEKATQNVASKNIQRFTEIRARWKEAGDATIASNGPEVIRHAPKPPKLPKPIDPTSPSQSQVIKAQFRSEDKSQKSEIRGHRSEKKNHKKEEKAYSEIGGLSNELLQLREMVEYPLTYPEMFTKLGIEAPKGVLLCGPPGCGKTLLARSIARATNAHFQVINGPELIGAYQGESENNLRKIFAEAEKHAPSILFFDEIDAITPKRDEASSAEKRLVTQLLTLMDGLESRGRIVVIASTNTPNDMDPALRRPGRFDREIWLSVPDQSARKNILEVHTKHMALAKDVDLKDLAARTPGYVGADLAALCREAGLKSIREMLPSMALENDASEARLNLDEEDHKKLLKELCVERNHFEIVLKELKPSSLRNQQANIPNIQWKEIGGLDRVKAELEEAIIWPIRHPQLFEQADVRPPRGILLTGPPGTGKTMMAKALASKSGINFISIKGPSLVSKYVGESEKAIREIFQQAQQAAPCILFFDEIDAIAPARGADASSGSFADRLVGQLLVEMDGVEKLNQVLVLGATNRPDAIDPALRRPGRFERIIQIPLPETDSRLEILKIHTARKPLDSSIDLSIYAEQTEGFSGADLESVCRLAALASVRRALIGPKSGEDKNTSGSSDEHKLAKIYSSDFEDAISKSRQMVQRRLIEEVADRAVEDRSEESTRPEDISSSASPFFNTSKSAQRRIRGEASKIALN